MKNPLDYTPVLRHELRRGLRARLWLPPVLLTLFFLPFLFRRLDQSMDMFYCLCILLAGVLIILNMAGHLSECRRKPGLDPATDSAYPRWRIVLEQSAACWLWLLPLPVFYGLIQIYTYPYTLFLERIGIAVLIGWLFTQLFLLWGAVTPLKSAGILILLAFFFLRFLMLLPRFDTELTSPVIAVLAALAMLAHGTALMPAGSNRALLLRPAVLIGAALIAVLRSDIGTDAFAAAGTLILIAAAGERWLPSRRQQAFLDRHPALKIPLFPFQSGFLPGLFTGAVVLGLTMNPEYWRRDIWFLLAALALFLCWRRFVPRLTLTLAGVATLLSALPLLVLFNAVPRHAATVLQGITGAALIALLPAARAYLERYFQGKDHDDRNV